MNETYKSFTAFHELAKEAAAAKAKWLDETMKAHMPKDDYEFAHHCSVAEKTYVAQWLKDEGFELREHPDRTELWRKDQHLGTFKVEFKK